MVRMEVGYENVAYFHERETGPVYLALCTLPAVHQNDLVTENHGGRGHVPLFCGPCTSRTQENQSHDQGDEQRKI